MHDATEEIRRGGLPIGIFPIVPDSNFVDLDIFDCFGLERYQILQLFDQKHSARRVSIFATGSNNSIEPFSFGF